MNDKKPIEVRPTDFSDFEKLPLCSSCRFWKLTRSNVPVCDNPDSIRCRSLIKTATCTDYEIKPSLIRPAMADSGYERYDDPKLFRRDWTFYLYLVIAVLAAIGLYFGT